VHQKLGDVFGFVVVFGFGAMVLDVVAELSVGEQEKIIMVLKVGEMEANSRRL
jgi:hypothetical protein